MYRRHARLASIAAGLFVVVLLAACQVTVGPTPTPPTGAITAQLYDPLTGQAPNVQASGQILGNEILYYTLSVPPSAHNLLYAEVLGSDLQVSLRTVGGTRLAVSRSPRFFAASVPQLTSSEVEAASIRVNYFCEGPCAAIRPQSQSYLVEVRNLSSSPRPYQVAAYSMLATDLNEPNDTAASATPFGAAGNPTGAIEWLGDEDWFRYTGTTDRVLTLTVYDLAPGMAIQFAGEADTLRGTLGGATTFLYPGDVFRVFSEAQRAGPSEHSRYLITTSPR
jgi:hypothetical protein